MANLSKKFFQDAYAFYPLLSPKILREYAQGVHNMDTFMRPALVALHGQATTDRLYLPPPVLRNEAGVIVTQPIKSKLEHFHLHLSRFTCGVCEIGALYGHGRQGQARMITSILLAIMCRRGKISFYMPATGHDTVLEGILNDYGFTETGAPFFNPNSSNQVQEWVAFNLGREENYVSK